MPQTGTILAQNLDQTGIYDGYQALFHIIEPEHDVEIMTVAYPGFIGTIGLNSKGVALCNNTIMSYLNIKFTGIPMIFLFRGILSKTNLSDAMNLMEHQLRTGMKDMLRYIIILSRI